MIKVKFGFDRLPAGIPDRLSITNVNMIAFAVQRGVIVSVSGDPAQPGILIKAVTARGIGQEREKVLISQVVDPGQRCLRGRDNILTFFIIKMAVFNKYFSDGFIVSERQERPLFP